MPHATLVHRSWNVAVRKYSSARSFEPVVWITASIAAGPAPGAPTSAIVEVCRNPMGMVPRATLGGRFEPGGTSLEVRVGSTGPDDPDHVPAFRSRFSRPMVAGLDDEFAPLARDGIVSEWSLLGCPAGTLTIDVGAFDRVDSSGAAFRLAARLLLVAMFEPPRTLRARLETEIDAVLATTR